MKYVDILNKISKYDTPTMCNALEAVMGTRTAVGFTKKQVIPADPSLPCIVGFAATAKIRASSPPIISPKKVQENRLSYYDYISSSDKPTIVAIEDTDYPNCTGAFWGELNVAIHKGLNIKGTLTNGLLRDIGMLDKGYQVLAGGIGPSHAFVHVTNLDQTVNVFGLEINPGDLIAEIKKCTFALDRFSTQLTNYFEIKCFTYDDQFTLYPAYMETKLQRRRHIGVPYWLKTNKKRNKNKECLAVRNFETQTKKINEPTIKIGEIIDGKNIKFEGSLNID